MIMFMFCAGQEKVIVW